MGVRPSLIAAPSTFLPDPGPVSHQVRASVLRANLGEGRVAHLSSFERWDSTSLSRLGSMAGGPPFVFLKGGIPRAYPAWDLWILRAPARSCISVGAGEDEKEARRCMSPRLPTFAKNKGAKVLGRRIAGLGVPLASVKTVRYGD